MNQLRRGATRRPARLALALIATTGLLAACQPGWTSAYIGTGDGTGTTPGAMDPTLAETRLQAPTSTVAIPGGGSYVYDSAACAIYKVAGDTTSLYAGTPGSCGNSGDAAPADDATIDAEVQIAGSPHDFMTLDGSGNLLFPGANGQVLRRVDATTGIISSITLPTDPGNDHFLVGLATDTSGSVVFLAENTGDFGATIFRLNADGSHTSLAAVDSLRPHGTSGLSTVGPGTFVVASRGGYAVKFVLRIVDSDAGTTTSTWIEYSSIDQMHVAGSSNGTFYAANADSYIGQVIRVDPDNRLAVVAGTGNPDTGTARQLGNGTDLDLSPTGLAVTPNSGLLVSSGHVVYRVGQPDRAGESLMVPGFLEPVVDTAFAAPGPLVVASGRGKDLTFYVVDVANCIIQKVDAGVVTTAAGTGTCGDTGDGGPATDAEITFGYPSQPGLDAAGNLYFIQDMALTTARIRKVSPEGTISTVSGTPLNNGNGISGLSVDPDGTITMNVSDINSSSIVRRSVDGTISSPNTYSTGIQVQLAASDHEHYVVQDATGNIRLYRLDLTTGLLKSVSNSFYIDSPLNGSPGSVATPDGTIYTIRQHMVYRVEPDNTIFHIAGNNIYNASELPLRGRAIAQFLIPTGLAVAPDGALLISSGHYVYRLSNPELAGY